MPKTKERCFTFTTEPKIRLVNDVHGENEKWSWYKAMIGMSFFVEKLGNGDFTPLSCLTGQPIDRNKFIFPKDACEIQR